MKPLLPLLALLLPAFVSCNPDRQTNSQAVDSNDAASTPIAIDTSDCGNYIHTVTDKYTHEPTVEGTADVMINDVVSMSLERDSSNAATDGIGLALWIRVGERCVHRGDQIVLTFTDGTRAEATNEIDNCNGNTFTRLNAAYENAPALAALRTKALKGLRVTTSNGYAEAELTAHNQTLIRRTIRCLLPSNR